MERITPGIALMRFPFRLGGTEIGRTVTLIRLFSGEVVIHSTANFSTEDVAAISAFGTPVAFVDVTFFHDTFARQGRAMFSKIPYFAPPGFESISGVAARPLSEQPQNWRGELEVLCLAGLPKVREHVFFHRPSRTLIVADLLFNLSPSASGWTWFFFRHMAGIRSHPGISRMFRFCIQDLQAFRHSLQAMMEWDFDRLIVAHGDIIETGAKPKVKAALQAQGF